MFALHVFRQWSGARRSLWLPRPRQRRHSPAPTKKFEIKNDRTYLGGTGFKIWGIRGGNAL
jgi:hypothetical protein